MPDYKRPDAYATIRRLAECNEHDTPAPAHIRRAARQILSALDALNAADWCAWAAAHRDEIDPGDATTAAEFRAAAESHIAVAFAKVH